MIADSVWVLTLVCLALLTAVFVFVIMNSADKQDYSEVQSRSTSLRIKWTVFLFALGIVVTLATLLPFPIPSQAGAGDATVVKVVGKQWYWEIDKTDFNVGELIEFHVTAGDVNHGFGIYNSDDKLLAQTQAMPGYVNKFTHTFDEPGTYKVLCMEFCGLAHHSMISQLTVR